MSEWAIHIIIVHVMENPSFTLTWIFTQNEVGGPILIVFFTISAAKTRNQRVIPQLFLVQTIL